MLPLAFKSASMSYIKYIEAFYFSKFYFTLDKIACSIIDVLERKR